MEKERPIFSSSGLRQTADTTSGARKGGSVVVTSVQLIRTITGLSVVVHRKVSANSSSARP